MSKSKKIILLMFTITLVINLQLTGTLTSGMDNGFSLEQLADNIFAPSALAEETQYFGHIKQVNGIDRCCDEDPRDCYTYGRLWPDCD